MKKKLKKICESFKKINEENLKKNLKIKNFIDKKKFLLK